MARGRVRARAGVSSKTRVRERRATQGVQTEADGRRFTVTYAKTCAFIVSNPTPYTKVGGMCGDAVLELQSVHPRVEAGVCGLWDTSGHMFVLDMLALCVRVRGR